MSTDNISVQDQIISCVFIQLLSGEKYIGSLRTKIVNLSDTIESWECQHCQNKNILLFKILYMRVFYKN